MRKKEECFFAVLLLGIVAAILSAHPLIDPDLGWNLAGGLWILDNLKIPSTDPLAALGEKWIDYCFLPEILFALMFKAFGFKGLLFFQIFTAFFFVVVAGMFIFSCIRVRAGLPNKLLPVILLAAITLFIAPVFHLRPQLFSALLFLLFLIWRIEQRGSLALAVILILWANTHVYWIFTPVILSIDYLSQRFFKSDNKISLKMVLLALLLPVVSPYGIDNYLPIIQYALFHSHVKEQIQEFQPLLYTEGYLLPVSCALFLIASIRVKKRAIPIENSILIFMFFLLSLWQMKFTPLFGVFSIVSLTKSLSDSIVVYPWSFRWVCYFFATFSSLVCSSYVLQPVGDSQRELLEIGKAASKFEGAIFTQFNSGGWIELGIYLSDRNSKAKPWIDGRTLVMGKERLLDYFSISSLRLDLAGFLDKKQIPYIILEKRAHITPTIYPDRSFLLFKTDNYLFLSRSLISVNNS